MQYTQKYQKREKKMKDFESLKTSLKNKVLTVVFNRPEKMNTFSGQMLKDILELLDEAEKDSIIKKLKLKKGKPKIEIQRFKGLGEISPDEFKNFIGEDMRIDPVIIGKDQSIEEVLAFYMGKNTPKRQEFIIDNLKVELDKIDEE